MSLDKEVRETFIELLKRAILIAGDVNSLSKAIGVSRGAIDNWIHGDSEPITANILKIERYVSDNGGPLQ